MAYAVAALSPIAAIAASRGRADLLQNIDRVFP
jgi:hypothetical protein